MIKKQLVISACIIGSCASGMQSNNSAQNDYNDSFIIEDDDKDNLHTSQTNNNLLNIVSKISEDLTSNVKKIEEKNKISSTEEWTDLDADMKKEGNDILNKSSYTHMTLCNKFIKSFSEYIKNTSHFLMVSSQISMKEIVEEKLKINNITKEDFIKSVTIDKSKKSDFTKIMQAIHKKFLKLLLDDIYYISNNFLYKQTQKDGLALKSFHENIKNDEELMKKCCYPSFDKSKINNYCLKNAEDSKEIKERYEIFKNMLNEFESISGIVAEQINKNFVQSIKNGIENCINNINLSTNEDKLNELKIDLNKPIYLKKIKIPLTDTSQAISDTIDMIRILFYSVNKISDYVANKVLGKKHPIPNITKISEDNEIYLVQNIQNINKKTIDEVVYNVRSHDINPIRLLLNNIQDFKKQLFELNDYFNQIQEYISNQDDCFADYILDIINSNENIGMGDIDDF